MYIGLSAEMPKTMSKELAALSARRLVTNCMDLMSHTHMSWSKDLQHRLYFLCSLFSKVFGAKPNVDSKRKTVIMLRTRLVHDTPIVHGDIFEICFK